MAITPLPTPPSRNDPTNFSARGDAFLGALPAFATEANALATQVNADSITASGAASAAAAQVDATAWVSGTTYAQGDIVWSPINYLAYRRKTNGAGSTDPSADAINWVQATGTGNLSVDSSGTSGEFLKSLGPGLNPTWSTLSTGAIGTDLSYVDYLLTTSSRLINATDENILSQSVSLDGISELMIFYGDHSAHAVVFNTSTNTFGTPVLVRTRSLNTLKSVALAKISSTSVLVCSLRDTQTDLQTVVLTVSGSTITVNTALATTLAAGSSLVTAGTRLVQVGSSYVLNYVTTSDSLPKFRAITVSGTTPSIGAELAYAGGTTNWHSYAHSSSVLLHFSATATVVHAFPITVSGTTLTAGGAATATTTSSPIVTGQLSNSRYALFYLNTTGRGAVVSISGTTASISTAGTVVSAPVWAPEMQVFGNQAFVLSGTSADSNINVITDTSGTATVGTSQAVPIAGDFVGYLNTGKVFFASNTAGNSTYYQYGISSGSAVLEKTFQNVTSTSVVTASMAAPYFRPLSGPNTSANTNFSISLRTSSGKFARGNTGQLPFAVSYDGTYPAKIQQAANPFISFNDGISEAVGWGIPNPQSTTTTTLQLRKVTLV